MFAYKPFKTVDQQNGVTTAYVGTSTYFLNNIEKDEQRRIQTFDERNPGIDWVIKQRLPSSYRSSIFQYDIVPPNQSDEGRLELRIGQINKSSRNR